MTNKQAAELLNTDITVRHRISGETYKIRLVEHWTGTVFFLAENVFGSAQTTRRPLFNVYPVELVEQN